MQNLIGRRVHPNPLAVPATEFEVGAAHNPAQLIVDPDGKGLDPHWQKTAFALLVGVILGVGPGRRDGQARPGRAEREQRLSRLGGRGPSWPGYF